MGPESLDALLDEMYYHPEKQPANMNNFYDRLELPDYSSTTKVKRQYRWHIAEKWDPSDKPEEHKKFFAAQFKAIMGAYEVLSNKQSKFFYDDDLRENGSDKTFSRPVVNLGEAIQMYKRNAKSFEKVGRENYNFGWLMVACMGITASQSIPDIGDKLAMVIDGCILSVEALFASLAFSYSTIQYREANRLYKAASYYANVDFSVKTSRYERALLKVGDTIADVMNKIMPSKFHS